MPTDAACSKFLYTIMKQLDLKSIDWNAVADELEITNGHAARMRYSRFKQQMEGVVPQVRKPRAPKKKDTSDDAPKPKKRKRNEQTPNANVPKGKDETTPMNGSESTATTVKPEPIVKAEPTPAIKSEPVVKQEPEEATISSFPLAPPLPIATSLTNTPAMPWPTAEPATIAPMDVFLEPYPMGTLPGTGAAPYFHTVKPEPTVKVEMEV
ncbi:MAG: hypothetical protein Q9218_007191 [Villophora microphyllina]